MYIIYLIKCNILIFHKCIKSVILLQFYLI